MAYYAKLLAWNSDNSKEFCTFLDAIKAFDRVDYCKLFSQLLKRDLPAVLQKRNASINKRDRNARKKFVETHKNNVRKRMHLCTFCYLTP